MKAIHQNTLSLVRGAARHAHVVCLRGSAKPSAPTEIERGFQSMYNLEFDQAHQDFSTWERLHPDDPLGPVSQAAGYLFGEFARLDILESQLFTNDKTFEARTKLSPDPKVRDEFDAAVDRGDQLADAALKQHPEDSNALFAKVLALGLRSDYVGHDRQAGFCRAALYEARREFLRNSY